MDRTSVNASVHLHETSAVDAEQINFGGDGRPIVRLTFGGPLEDRISFYFHDADHLALFARTAMAASLVMARRVAEHKATPPVAPQPSDDEVDAALAEAPSVDDWSTDEPFTSGQQAAADRAELAS